MRVASAKLFMKLQASEIQSFISVASVCRTLCWGSSNEVTVLEFAPRPETYLETSRTSVMELFCKNSERLKPLTTFTETFHHRCLTRF